MESNSELEYYKNKLIETENKLKIIADFTMDSGYWINPEGKLIYQSPSIEIITGYKAEEFQNNHPDLFTSLIHPDDLELFSSDFLENEGTGSDAPKVFRIINKNGEIRWLETLSKRIYDDNRKFLGIRGSTRDITEAKQKDMEIAISEERYRHISEIISDWAYSFIVKEDGSTEADWVTDAYSRITGDDAKGKIAPENWMGLIHPDDREITDKRQNRLTKEGLVSIDEYRIVNKIGETTWIKDYGYPVMDPVLKRVIRVVGAAQDITELKHSENRLQKSLTEKELLLKEIHHRIKNNLAMLTSLLHLQLFDLKDESTKEIFHKLENQIESIGMIHEKLYKSEDLSTISLKEYVNDLIFAILDSFSVEATDVQIDITDTYLGLDLALPLGLIINELTINAIKHGFSRGKNNKLIIKINKDEIDTGYILSFYNKVYSAPNNMSDFKTESLGMRLVHLLSEQINGNLIIDSSNGFLVELKFLI